MRHATVIVALPSEVMTAGVETVLSHHKEISTTVVNAARHELIRMASTRRPSLIIVDPLMTYETVVSELRTVAPTARIVSLSGANIPPETARIYDENLSVYDSADALRQTLTRATQREEDPTNDDDRKELSPREKEVVIGIVKGLSNKEIAASMNVSVNTVMTHRRNIAGKLKIHSPAGLTIYAIVSKLVSLEEVSL